MLKAIQLPLAFNNYLIAYYQTLDEFTCLLRQEKINKINVLKKLEKNCKFYQKTSKSGKVKSLKTHSLKLKTMQLLFI